MNHHQNDNILFSYYVIIIPEHSYCKFFGGPMAEIQIPEYVRTVLAGLADKGFKACIVGGCVRDMFLGVEPNDWDIASDALPQQVMQIFPRTLPTGIKHGTVTVMIGKEMVEVTTFRTDGEYADHRHPDSVDFTDDLSADLSRRDFTINAIAFTSSGDISDPFHGLEDIKSGIIRCVGEANKRFEEDALRMFRAFRFSSRLGFEIDRETFNAIASNASLAGNLSAERVRDEIEKIILSSHPEYMYYVITLGLMDSFFTERRADKMLLSRISELPGEALVRWFALCRCLTSFGCISSADDFLRELKLDGQTIRCCSAASCISLENHTDVPQVKRFLRDFGEDAVRCAFLYYDTYNSSNNMKLLSEVLKKSEPWSLDKLALKGSELVSLGLKGQEIGRMQKHLLNMVIDDPASNSRDCLISIASADMERIRNER